MNVEFSVGPLQDSSILHIYSMREQIQIDPPYQRDSDIWTLEKQQLLIDSILNGFDIPKLYFHEFMPAKKIGGKSCKYAIVDGKQRLQAIWKFIEQGLPLASDFEFLHDSNVHAAGMTYGDLAQKYPTLKIRFDSKTLPITAIRTDDIELIEEMFSRLNEAIPLNGAEKRNAWGGPIPPTIREVVKHDFFKNTIKVTNKRYKHHDIATKFLLIEHKNGIVDTKKEYLDEFVRSFKDRTQKDATSLRDSCEEVLQALAAKFTDKDSLLSSIGMVTVYYLLFREAKAQRWYTRITRNVFDKFEETRLKNKEIAEGSIADARYDLLEFGRLSQSPNDAPAIEFRLSVLKAFVHRELGLTPSGARSKRKVPAKKLSKNKHT